MIKKFSRIIESLSERVELDPELDELQSDIIDIIETSTNSDDIELQLEVIESYIEDSETTIMGLVNDSDLFDFYLKHRNQIDKVLSEVEHFEKSPSELGTNSSIYEYLVTSTKIGIQEVLKKMTGNRNETI